MTTVILEGLAGEKAGREFSCAGLSQVIIGRSRSCTLHLADDPTVSRHHCLLDIDEAGVRLQDLGSKNGTFLNGEPIAARKQATGEDATYVDSHPVALHSGDELRLGHHVFLVQIVEAASVNVSLSASRSLVLA